MYTWNTLDARSGRVEPVECFHSLEDALADLRLLAWEDPTRHHLDYVTEDATGVVAAVALFGAELELFIATYDGRRLEFERPESYREIAP